MKSASPEKKRILIVDDHSVTRRGVKALVETKPNWTVCGEASNGSEAILKTKTLKPDVVIMDISMPEINGIEASQQIHREMPNVGILILTVHESEEAMRSALDAGASGYVLKSDLDVGLVTAIEALCHGKKFFSAKASAIILEGYAKGSLDSPRASQPPARLSPRQREIVQYLANGKVNKEIASTLNISVKTVEAHRALIMSKLRLRSFSALVRYAVRHGMVSA
jgi:DNA-binding NarL/FixJ family response regulator